MYQERLVTYNWQANTDECADKWYNCGSRPAEVLENCDISLTIILKPVAFGVRLRKTNHASCRVSIHIQVESRLAITANKVEWTETFELCQFREDPEKFQTYVNVKCDITWFRREPVPPNLWKKLHHFCLNPTFSDVKIVIGNEELPAHKMILAAYSSVFAAMLTNPMREANEHRIQIVDANIETMRIVLQYLYQGSTENLNNTETIMRVWIVADKYNIEELKLTCEFRLMYFLDLTNVVAVLRDADSYEARMIKDICFDFIYVHRDRLDAIPEFQVLCIERPHLAYSLMLKFGNDRQLALPPLR
uniref:BTB domain-containing protein n=1 Tax=Bracon brevicornis TaxID=1563983 RepID=A0A6V7M1G4_9HYME